MDELNLGQVQIAERPTVITVFGVLDVVFGSMGLMSIPIRILAKALRHHTSEMTAEYKVWSLFLSVLTVCFAIWLVFLGIGLLNFRKWARRGSIVYASVRIIWFFMAWGINIIMVFLGWLNLSKGGWGLFFLGIAIGSIGLIYPVLLLIFMQTEKVKRAFTAVGG